MHASNAISAWEACKTFVCGIESDGIACLLVTAVAVLGLGQMGTSIARRLLATGHQVTVWNRTVSRAEALRSAGASVATSAADAAQNSGVVITMLADMPAVDAVLFGPDGAAGALNTGACVVQMSTVSPQATRDLAKRLPPEVALIDAPVAGSVSAAESGQLRVLAGGDDASIDNVAAVLASLGTVQRCGGIGSASGLKLVLNTALVTSVAALADTLQVADAVGTDRNVALDTLRSGPLSGAVARATTTGASFSLALAAKDVELALGELGNAPAPLVHATKQALRAVPDQSADIAALVFPEHP